jgi:uncharacterized protein YbbC (DUF1343 family)
MKTLYTVLIFIFSLNSFAIEYGIERIEKSGFDHLFVGKKLAVLTHAAAQTENGTHLIDILFKRYQLLKIFSPEHGLRTLADEWVDNGVDSVTGLPVISLYKKSSKAPEVKDLEGIDAVVIDLQDVGVRYYTYFSTIAELMKVSGKLGVEVIILDRPNLIGGNILEGIVLDQELTGKFVSYYDVPSRHGMSLGELSNMINQEKNLNVKLTIVPVKDWFRENVLFTLTRQWIPPSPAIVEKEQVALYALWGFLENFNIAVGRGLTNELAFKVIGAPWISEAEAVAFSNSLNQLGFEGVSFSPFCWEVTRSTHKGERVHGVKINWNLKEIRTDEFNYKVSQTLYRHFKERLTINGLAIPILGSKKMFEAIRSQVPWENFKQEIDDKLELFKKRRRPYLLYESVISDPS